MKKASMTAYERELDKIRRANERWLARDSFKTNKNGMTTIKHIWGNSDRRHTREINQIVSYK